MQNAELCQMLILVDLFIPRAGLLCRDDGEDGLRFFSNIFVRVDIIKDIT